MSATTPASLSDRLAGTAPPTVLDVRLAEDHAACRIPGSLNQCVFETVFLDELGKQVRDPATPLVIIGSSADSHEAAMAAEKLARAGFKDVVVLEGGLAAWVDEQRPTEGDGEASAPAGPLDGSHDIDLGASTVTWTGRNLLNHHSGTVGLKSGRLAFDAGRLVGGRIDFDLADLRCLDLAGSELHDVLIDHLHDHDFLDLERFPDASLEITAGEAIPPAAPGSPNLRVTARLELKGCSHEIQFEAASGLTPEGRAAAQACFAIDRTRWGILYGSGRFFDRLAGHLVNDQIEFQVKVVTT